MINILRACIYILFVVAGQEATQKITSIFFLWWNSCFVQNECCPSRESSIKGLFVGSLSEFMMSEEVPCFVFFRSQGPRETGLPVSRQVLPVDVHTLLVHNSLFYLSIRIPAVPRDTTILREKKFGVASRSSYAEPRNITIIIP